ncbi:MAG: hypothetical protein JSW39_03685 [Desulfobacterales bacterium]|nr:MAG: hypothetical protein JSW39_03685 [Desulfobacterales bacterium]
MEPQRNQGQRLKVFLPDARILSAEEIAGRPAEKKEMAQAAGQKGIWLEVDCPEDECLIEQSSDLP